MPTIIVIPVLPADNELEIPSIPTNNSCDRYSCLIHILSDAKHNISDPLSNIINISVQVGVIPTKLKREKVTPVYKSDDESEPGNYRPISSLSICNKKNVCCNTVMCTSRSKPFLTKTISYLYHSMVPVKKYSTQQSVIDIANVIQKNMDLRMFYLGIILD